MGRRRKSTVHDPSTNATALLTPAAYAPFSHLSTKKTSPLPPLTSSALEHIANAAKRYAKATSGKVETVQLHKEKRKDEELLGAYVRRLQQSAPTDAPGHWALNMAVAASSSTASSVAFCKHATTHLNSRRAMARQDFDYRKLCLDKRNVFTKDANETRTSTGLSVSIHNNHNLHRVLKDVSLNAKRRVAVVPGPMTKKMQATFAPKLPPKYKVLQALESSQEARKGIDEEELKIFEKVLRKQSVIRRFKIKKGGMACSHLDLGVDGDGEVIDNGSVLSAAKPDYDSFSDEESTSTLATSTPAVPKRKSTLMIENELPSLQERYGIKPDAFLKEPVKLLFNKLESINVNARLGKMAFLGAVKYTNAANYDSNEDSLNSASLKSSNKRDSLSVATEISFTSVETFAAKNLKKKNFQLLESFQKADPRINGNAVRKKKAESSHPSSLAGIAKFKVAAVEEVEPDVTVDLTKFYKNNNLGLGWRQDLLPFMRREKCKSGDSLSSEWVERMEQVWRCLGVKKKECRMDTELWLCEGLKEESLVSEYIDTWEVLIDSCFVLQVLRMKHAKEAEAREYKTQKEKEAANRRKRGLGGHEEEHDEEAEETGEDVLPNETVVFLMRNDLYFSQQHGVDNETWIQGVVDGVVARGEMDVARLASLSGSLGLQRVKQFLIEFVAEFLQDIHRHMMRYKKKNKPS